MRDGHLPRVVHLAAGGDPATSHEASISRFTATAASLAAPGAILQHVERELGLNPATLARQILLPEADIARLIDEDDPQGSSLNLLREVRSGTCRKQLRRAARGFAERLVAHVRQLCDPAPGDVLMLVDLGYNGSAQNRIDSLLAQQLGVHVAGRYLLLREANCPALDKRGFISSVTHDPQLLSAMCANVAVLEQLSTAATGSVVDYEEDGTPIRSANDIKGAQSAVREEVQRGCVDFVHAARQPIIVRGTAHETLPLWRDAATAALLRLMFLPLPDELAAIADFEHDVNLGSERTVPLFDHGVAAQGMRTRGLFYMKGSERMYLPAELSQEDISTRLSLFAQRRFALDLAYPDFSEERLVIPAIFLDGDKAVQSSVTAQPTHGGYYTAAVPIGANQLGVALQFGRLFEYVQIDSIAAVPAVEFLSTETHIPVPFAPVPDGMEQVAPHLFRCLNEQAVLLAPPGTPGEEPMVLAFTFRPVSWRGNDARQTALIAA